MSFRVTDNGSTAARRGGGGLVTALGGLARSHAVTWVAHAMGDGDVAARASFGEPWLEEVSRDGAPYRLRFVGEPDETYGLHYHTFCNPLLWFVQHRLYGFGTTPTITRSTYAAWRAYAAVNERFATAIAEEARRALDDGEQPVAMLHDYQLFLLPGMVRALVPELAIQFFQHVPWPGPGAWRCLPSAWVVDLLESLLASDIIGLQTAHDLENMLRIIGRRLPDATITQTLPGVAQVERAGRVTQLRAYPISVAVEEFDEHVRSSSVSRLRERIAALRPVGGHLIVRVDRTDPSKNIIRGFEAYELLLREHPELHQRVVMFCQLDPSRQQVDEYATYLERLHAVAGAVNARYGSGSWQPIVVHADASFRHAVAAYCEYDVLFVNPVADGMNLVSKEGPLVNEHDGVVVLSEQAGSFNELGEHVVAVNPFDVAGQADALYRALSMPAPERARRAAALREHVRAHDVESWITSQLDDIEVLAGAGGGALAR